MNLILKPFSSDLDLMDQCTDACFGDYLKCTLLCGHDGQCHSECNRDVISCEESQLPHIIWAI